MNRIPVVVAWAGSFVACALLAGSPLRAVVSKRVSGNLVFWDQTRGFDSIVANADVFSEISPFWYRVLADGRVVPYTTGSGASYEDPAILAFLRSRGILVIPTVANIINGVWDGGLVSKIIADPQLRAVNLNALVNLAVAGGYDGIDLDYENLRASDRAAFSSFVQQLAGALHAQGKLLTVNVYAKTSEPGTWDGPQAQDWWAIGQAADQVRIMTYEYSWSTSPPGPIAPVNWVNNVIGYATSQIAPGKILQGIPFYGYDWVGQQGTDLAWTQAMDLTSQFAVPVMWDSASASPWFEYSLGLGAAHGLVRKRLERRRQARCDSHPRHRRDCRVAARRRGPRQLVGGAAEIRGRITTAAGRHSSECVNHLANRRRVARQEAAN